MSHTDGGGGGRSTRSARESGGDMQGAAPKPRKGGPPPLAWLIIGLLLVIGLVAWLTTNGSRAPVRDGPNMPVDTPQDEAVVERGTVPDVAPAAAPIGPQTAPSNVTPP